MSKKPDQQNSERIDRYSGSSSSCVWTVLGISTVLIVVAVIGTTSII